MFVLTGLGLYFYFEYEKKKLAEQKSAFPTGTLSRLSS